MLQLAQLRCSFRLLGTFVRSQQLHCCRGFVSRFHCNPVASKAMTSNRNTSDVILNAPSGGKYHHGCRRRERHTTSAVEHDYVESLTTLSDEVFRRTITLPVRTGNTVDRKSFNAVWLRENCRCSTCYNVATEQRIVEFHRLSDDAFHSNLAFLTEDNLSQVHWADGHVSSYHPAWLNTASNAPTIDASRYARRLWDADQMSNFDDQLERVEYDSIVDSSPAHATGSGLVAAEVTPKSNGAVRKLLGNLLRHGFAFIDGVPDNEESTIQVTKSVCPTLRTFFGEHWTFGVDEERQANNNLSFSDTAYLNVGIGVHTDGTYWTLPPGVQVLHCIRRGTNGAGGDTLLVDGFHAAEQLRRIDRDAFQLLTELRLGHRYLEPGKFQYGCSEPILRLSPSSTSENVQMESIRYNPYDRAPIGGPMQADVYRALAALGRLIDSPSAAIQLRLSPGRVLFVDNWRVLHGRTAFSGPRILSGCYLSRDDWISRARSLRLLSSF